MADKTPLRTTDATPAVLATIEPTSSNGGFSVWEIRVLAIATSGARAGYVRTAALKHFGGVVSLVGAVGTPTTHEDVSGWNCTIDLSGNAARIVVTGAAATTIDWYLQNAMPLLGMAPSRREHPAIPRGCGWAI